MYTTPSMAAGLIGLALLSTTVFGQPATPHRQPADPSVQSALFERALQLHREGLSAGAYGRFIQLADQGHVEAARMAWWMHRQGPALYGASWYASQPQQRAWAALLLRMDVQPSDDAGE